MTSMPLFGKITILSLSLVNFQVSRFHVSHLTHETFKLCLQNTLNMSKTARVYFGVLQFSPPYKNFVLEYHTLSFACSMSGSFFSCLLQIAFLIFSFHFYSICRISITSLSSIHASQLLNREYIPVITSGVSCSSRAYIA